MISERTLVTILLTLRLDAESTAALKPLESGEWTELARFLNERSLAPESLLQQNAAQILSEWRHPRIEAGRLLQLLQRDARIVDLLGTWHQQGMWALGRSDPAYPARFRERLRDVAPPVLFGFGDPDKFSNRGIALVGSRNASDRENAVATRLGSRAAEAGFNVVSGGARGIDTHSEQGAFAAGGTVVSILGDSLVSYAGKPRYAEHLERGDLALITPYSPTAGFSSGNAMGRNRLIYCLADAAIAVCSTRGKGGTFAGASEAIRRGWVPVWVPPSDDPESGNGELIARGGHALDLDSGFTIEDLTQVQPADKPAQQSLFG